MRRREGRERGGEKGIRREVVVVSSKLGVLERGKRRGIYSIK